MSVEEDKSVAYSESAPAGCNVIMSNTLTRAAHSLTPVEKRLIAACIVENDSIPLVELRKEDVWQARLSTVEYAEAFGVDASTAYEQLQGASDSLFNCYVRVMRETHKGSEEFKFRWVGSTKYYKGEGWIEPVWLQEVVPHLFSLHQEFTTYKSRRAAALHSIYTWCLFECFESWAVASRYTPTVEEFRRAMGASEGQRRSLRNLRRRVIELTVKELREENSLHVEWKPETTNRKVVRLDFRFHIPPQRALF